MNHCHSTRWFIGGHEALSPAEHVEIPSSVNLALGKVDQDLLGLVDFTYSCDIM